VQKRRHLAPLFVPAGSARFASFSEHVLGSNDRRGGRVAAPPTPASASNQTSVATPSVANVSVCLRCRLRCHCPPSPGCGERRSKGCAVSTTSALSCAGDFWSTNSVQSVPPSAALTKLGYPVKAILDVAHRQRVSDVHHHDQTDNFWRAIDGASLPPPGPLPTFGPTLPSGDNWPHQRRTVWGQRSLLGRRQGSPGLATAELDVHLSGALWRALAPLCPAWQKPVSESPIVDITLQSLDGPAA
jgi:hypothetical protein